MNSTSDICQRLMAMSDYGYRAFTARLLPTIAPERIIGVRAPQVAALAKALKGSAEAERFLADLPHRYLEENGLHAALINQQRNYAAALEATKRFLPYVDNWATCDSLAPTPFAQNTGLLLPEVQKWIADQHEYTVRFGIGMLMRHYLQPSTFDTEHLRWVATVGRTEYYIRMMQAWYFATALAMQWHSTLPYMQRGAMDEWVRRKAIQKAIESRRIGDYQKQQLRQLRCG